MATKVNAMQSLDYSPHCSLPLIAVAICIGQMDWSALQQCIKNGNTTDFLKHLTESLQTGNKRFGILQKGLRTHCYQQVRRSDTSVKSRRAYLQLAVIYCCCRCQIILPESLCAKPCFKRQPIQMQLIRHPLLIFCWKQRHRAKQILHPFQQQPSCSAPAAVLSTPD